jgi:predicted RNA-binding protein with PIN domain
MYLIDGHNLIPKIPGLSLADIDDEMRLADWLQVFCQRQQQDVEVFFDQAPPGSNPKRRWGRLIMHFVRQGTLADSAIETRLAQLGKAARNVTVVSSDRRVQMAARNVHANVMPSEDFAVELIRPGPEKRGTSRTEGPSLSDEEISEWEDLFRRRPRNKG